MRRILLPLMVSLGVACGAAQRGEGLEPTALPLAVRADYELFADRCSRCHSLARPLNARITDDDQWQDYVNRMRSQPGSGIAPDDVPGLMRFLAYLSAQRRAPRDGGAP